MQNDEQAIRELVQTWFDATQRGDLETVLNLMTDDVIFMVCGQEPFGKKEFAANSKQMKDPEFEGTSDIQELKVLGDWAWMRNFLRIRFTPPNGATVERSGYTLTILRKDKNGRWAITRDANLLTTEGK